MDDSLKGIRKLAQSHIMAPSNSFSIDNPNELLLIDGSLIGLFYPSKSEVRNPRKFLRRILNSRLIYANVLKVAILADEHNPIFDFVDIYSSADIIIHQGEEDHLIGRLHHPAEKILSFSISAKQKNIQRFYRDIKLFEFFKDKNTKYKPLSFKEKEVAKYGKWDIKTQNITSEKIWLDEKAYTLFFKNFENKFTSAAQSLQSFLTYSFFMRFIVEENKIHENNRFNDGYAFFNSPVIIEKSFDINNICFAGFIPAEIGSLDECEKLIKKYQENGKKKY